MFLLFTFFFTLPYLQCRVFPELSIATTIAMLTPASCYSMTSFNYGSKSARDLGLTCGCHLNNVMPDSIFYDSMERGMTLGFF